MIPVRDTSKMIRAMNPRLCAGAWVFCTFASGDTRIATVQDKALAMMREPEGLSLLLAQETATALGFPADPAMVHILLGVASALDGVGLTAAVSGVLAEQNIPCNIIAGAVHDHIFVPQSRGPEALAVLEARARAQGAAGRQ